MRFFCTLLPLSFFVFASICNAQEKSLKGGLNGNPDFPAYIVKESDGGLTKLRKQQINAVLIAYKVTRNHIQTGSASIMELGPIQEKLLDAQLKFHQKKSEQLEALERALELAKQIEDQQAKRYAMGAVQYSSAAMASYFRIAVEIRMEELKTP